MKKIFVNNYMYLIGIIAYIFIGCSTMSNVEKAMQRIDITNDSITISSHWYKLSSSEIEDYESMLCDAGRAAFDHKKFYELSVIVIKKNNIKKPLSFVMDISFKDGKLFEEIIVFPSKRDTLFFAFRRANFDRSKYNIKIRSNSIPTEN